MKQKQPFLVAALCCRFLLSCAHALPAPSGATLPTAATSFGVRLPVSFTAPDKGFISLALYDKNGVLVRSLLYAKPVEKGKQTVEWDGTTDLGMPAPVGTYAAKGVFFTQSPRLDYQMIVGKSGNPPWRTADGKGDWGGNLGFPSSIVSNGKSLALGYACVEDNQITGIQQMDGDATIGTRYFSFYPWDTRLAAAMDDANYYLGIMNAGKKQIEIAQYKIGESRGKILTVLPTKPHENQAETRWRGRFSVWLDGLAVTPDTLFASIRMDDALFVIDRASGQIRQQISLPSPRGLAISSGKLLVVSGNQVLRLSLDGKVEKTLVPDGVLQQASALAVDESGQIYVGDGGEISAYGPTAYGGSHQVCVFSPEGKLLRRIGKTGGAPREGHFDEGGLGVITSLCIGPGEGGAPALWVNDIATGFLRTSRWSLDGKLQHQWFGRKLSLFSDVFNPARPTELITTYGAFADEPGISAYEMDMAKKTWRPSWHYDNGWNDMYQEDVFLSNKHGGNPLNGPRGAEARWPVFQYASRNFVTYRGRNYFMVNSGNDNGAIFTYSSDHKPQPVALVSFHRAQKTADGKIEGFYDQGPNNWFNWADRNGDGKMALDEMTYTEKPALLEKTARLNEARLDDNLNVVMKRFVNDGGKISLVDSILPLKELLPNGAPIYDWSEAHDITPLQPPDLNGGDGLKAVRSYQMPIPLETSDAYYSMVEPQADKPLVLPGIDGQGWWASRNWRTKVARFDKTTGKPLWAVGRRAPGMAEPGQMYHPAALAGVAGGAVFVTDTLGPVWVWSTEGLFLGHVYNNFGSGIQDDQTLYGEIQATTVSTDPKTGKIYAIANDTGAHIHEVILPKITSLTAGQVGLNADQASKVVPWDPDGRSPLDKPTFEAGYVAQPPTIDGIIDGREWQTPFHGANRPAMGVLLDGESLGTVRAMWDEKNLYLAYQIRDKNGPLNSGSELPYGPFVSGSYVDFSIGSNWTGPRDEVREGDARVILARIKDGDDFKTFQQGFWQKKRGGAHPQTITSPAAQVTMDDIAEIPGLEVAYKVEARDAKSGLVSYAVEAAIPLAALGISNPDGKTLGFDASIGVANASGDRRERAAHWAGLSEGVVVDRPGSIRLLPQTWGTLTFAR